LVLAAAVLETGIPRRHPQSLRRTLPPSSFPVAARRKPAAKTSCSSRSEETAMSMLFQRDAQTLRAGRPSRSHSLGKILFFVFCPLIFLFASGCMTKPPEGASVSLAAVKVGGKYGYIDASGREVIPLSFNETWGFAANGLALFRKDEKWGYIDASGREVIPPRLDYTWGFSDNGLAPAKVDGKWGYIDASGKEVIPPRYGNAWKFSPQISIPPVRKTSEAQ
jgi:hypothetical protein